jgi:predicted RNA binding protein YcfA (HicA-like mRNA interferase family)
MIVSAPSHFRPQQPLTHDVKPDPRVDESDLSTPIPLAKILPKEAFSYIEALFSRWSLSQNLNLIDLLGVHFSSLLTQLEEIFEKSMPLEIQNAFLDCTDLLYRGWHAVYVRGAIDDKDPIGGANSLHNQEVFPSFSKLFPRSFSKSIEHIYEWFRKPEKPKEPDRREALQIRCQLNRYNQAKPLLDDLALWFKCIENLDKAFRSDERILLGILIELPLSETAELKPVKQSNLTIPQKDILHFINYISRLYVPRGSLDKRTSIPQFQKFKGLANAIVQEATKAKFNLKAFQEKEHNLFEESCTTTDLMLTIHDIWRLHKGVPIQDVLRVPYHAIRNHSIDRFHAWRCVLMSFQLHVSTIVFLIENRLCADKIPSSRTTLANARRFLAYLDQFPISEEFKKNSKESKFKFINQILKELEEHFAIDINSKIFSKFLAKEHRFFLLKAPSLGREGVRKDFNQLIHLLAKKGPTAFKKAKEIVEKMTLRYAQKTPEETSEEIAHAIRADLNRQATTLVYYVSFLRSAHLFAFSGDLVFPESSGDLDLLSEELVDLLNLEGLEEKIDQVRAAIPEDTPKVDAEETPPPLGDFILSPTTKEKELEFKIAPPAKVRKLRTWLIQQGFKETPARGSHMKFIYPDTGKSAIVPHQVELQEGTKQSLFKQIEMAIQSQAS